MAWSKFNGKKYSCVNKFDKRVAYSKYHQSSSSSCRAASTLSPILPIVHHLWQVFRATSSHSCCMYVRAGRPAFARHYVGVHRSTSLLSSSLLLRQCPACLVHLTWIVFAMENRWPYSWYFVGCCCQDLFNIARNCRLASYPAVLLASKWCIHKAVSTR